MEIIESNNYRKKSINYTFMFGHMLTKQPKNQSNKNKLHTLLSLSKKKKNDLKILF